CSNGRFKSYNSLSSLIANAFFFSPGEIEDAISSPVTPLEKGFSFPSGKITFISVIIRQLLFLQNIKKRPSHCLPAKGRALARGSTLISIQKQLNGLSIFNARRHCATYYCIFESGVQRW